METLGLIISIAIYALYFSGLLLAFYDMASVISKRFKLRYRLAARNHGVGDLKIDAATAKLFPFCLMIFVSALVLAVKSFIMPVALMAAFLAGTIPYLVLLLYRARRRKKAGREGVSLITELCRQYRIKNSNIYEAIEASIVSGASFPVCRSYLSLLLMKLRDAGSRSAVSAACRGFSFSIGSLWGRMLSKCIETAVFTGSDISEALSDIADQLSFAQKQQEERKRLNSEAVRMTVFLVPMLYAGTMVIAARFLKIELSDILRNQFASPEGLLLLLLSVFLFLLDLILLGAVENSAADI